MIKQTAKLFLLQSPFITEILIGDLIVLHLRQYLETDELKRKEMCFWHKLIEFQDFCNRYIHNHIVESKEMCFQ